MKARLSIANQKGGLPVLLVGLLFVPVLLGFIDRLSDPSFAPQPPDISWRPKLIGAATQLPLKDLSGRPLPSDRPVYVVTMPCSSCIQAEKVFDLFQNSKKTPLAVVFYGDRSDIPQELCSGRRSFAILADARGDFVPREMLQFAPLCARVGATGKIDALQGESETVEQFLGG